MQTRRSLRSEENDSRDNGGEKMSEEEKSRTDSLWQSFLSDTATSSKNQNSSKSEDKSGKVSVCQKESSSEKLDDKKKLESNTSSIKSEIQKTYDNNVEKTVEKKETDSESSDTPVLDAPTASKTPSSDAELSIESTDNSNCQDEESNQSSCSEDKLKLENSNSHKSCDTVKNNSKISLFNKSKGFGSPFSALGSKKRGLSSILSSTSKVPKLSTLEKSKRDWNQFKDEHQLEEELSTFNRGKNGYLEKQDFLKRTDLRQFEMEKELRNVERRKH